jgi:SAM-dependent methyltransferase
MSWELACPACREPLGPLPGAAAGAVTCGPCGRSHACRDGVWDFLAPGRSQHFARFLAEYGTVRRAEGRGAADPAWYRALPEVPAGDPLAWQWRIRAASAAALARELAASAPAGARVLDLGAGCGWLSARLRRAGYRPLALDLCADPLDGLGAARHYDGDGPAFPRLLAEFDRLPLAPGAADVAVFNAAFHYSPDYDATLAEARRVLGPRGRVRILDSPAYPAAADGEAMVAERKARFSATYGFPSDALGSREYLVDGQMPALAARHGFTLRRVRPGYGLAWRLRPWRARLARRRRPSQFILYCLDPARP